MVREVGLEPTHREALAPKASVSTNFTTRACCFLRLLPHFLRKRKW